MRARVLLIALLVLSSGCLGFDAPGDDGDATDGGTSSATAPVEPPVVNRTIELGADVPADPLVMPVRVELGGAALEGTVLEAFFEFGWSAPAHRWVVVTTLPDGSTLRSEPPQAPATTTRVDLGAEVDELLNGTYGFAAEMDAPALVEDALNLTLHVRLRLPAPVGDAATAETASNAPAGVVTVRRAGDEWVASQTSRGTASSTPPPDVVAVELDTVNGQVDLHVGDTSTDVEVTRWARGSTQEEARQRLATVRAPFTIEPDHVDVDAEAPDWSNVGVDIALWVPEDAAITGNVDTTNGPVTLHDVALADVAIDTTNAIVSGDATVRGTFGVDTSNGLIQLGLRPVDDTTISVDATNGQVTLDLFEAPDIAYDIQAGTTNGQITEDMDEAELRGDDRNARLLTTDGSGRPIQVRGIVETINGMIHFGSGSGGFAGTGHTLAPASSGHIFG